MRGHICNTPLQYNSLAFVAGFKRATDEGSLPEIAQYSPYYLPLNVFTASRGSNLYILFIACALQSDKQTVMLKAMLAMVF